MRRVGIVGMWHETNTYSPRATTLQDFGAFELLEGDALVRHHAGTRSVIAGFVDTLRSADLDVVPIFSAGAWPGGPPDRETTEALLARLDRAVARAPRLDGLLVNLHGAMVGEGTPDMEAETLALIRARYPDVPLLAVLDLHANFSDAACAFCDGVVGYRTYPHVDMYECGGEAATLLIRSLDGVRFVTAYGKLAHLTTPLAQGTSVEPMRGLIARAEQRAADVGVDRVSLLPGFPYSDVDRCGFCVLATATSADAAIAVVRETLADVEAHLPAFAVLRPAPADAVREALARHERPVVLADIADNVGGGSPGDGTVLLRELIAQHAAGAVVIIADPNAAAAAHGVGRGARLILEIGGHSDGLHGAPVRSEAEVVRLGDGSYRAGGTWMTGQSFSMGPCAVLAVENGVTVLVTSVATPPFHIEQLTSNGIYPGAASIVVAKGAVAWRAAYEDVMASAIEVDTPGCCPIDPHLLTRHHPPRAVTPAIVRRATG